MNKILIRNVTIFEKEEMEKTFVLPNLRLTNLKIDQLIIEEVSFKVVGEIGRAHV